MDREIDNLPITFADEFIVVKKFNDREILVVNRKVC